MNRLTKIKITELNPHVICVLCGGYYINATTIVECLHSFCRTCITRYLETSKYCPVCDVMVHKTRPLEYIRSDKTLQDLVYKLVPGLYKSEMKRRREYYALHDNSGVPQPPSEDRGTEFHDRIIYTEDEKISLSLELCAEGIPFKTPSSIHGHDGPENIKISDVRYLSCPAAFSVGNLKKFIRMKFDLKLKYEIDVFHTAEPLPDYYTLMDIAYIYTWTRRAPLRLYYTVYECKIPRKIPELICVEKDKTVGSPEKILVVEQKVLNGQEKPKRKRKIYRKRKLPDGPDDVVPDFEAETTVQAKANANERRKDTVGRKKQKRMLVASVDNSVMEAMSESEEQLAKLTLNCSNEFGAITVDTGGDSSSQSDLNELVNKHDEGGIQTADKDFSNMFQDDNSEKTVVYSNADAKSTPQISPGSISISMFQPLNDAESENITLKTNRETVFDFQENGETGKGTKPKGRGGPGRKKKSEVGEKKAGRVKANDKQTGSLVISGKHPDMGQLPEKKKRGRKKKSETMTNSVGESENKSNTKSTAKVNSETGERVKRKYVRKAIKTEQSGNTTQTPKKGRKPKQEETKVGPKISKADKKDEGVDKISNIKKTKQNDSEDSVNGGPKSKENKLDCVSDKGSNECNSKVSQPDDDTAKVGDNLEICQVASPSTPLYGQTPKVTESNQGLPISPNPECAANSVLDVNEGYGKLFNTINEPCSKDVDESINNDGAPKCVNENTVCPAVVSDATEVDYSSNMALRNDDMDAKLVIDERSGVENGYHNNGVDMINEHYRNGDTVPLLRPSQDALTMDEFHPNSPGPKTDTFGSIYAQMDQTSDQPLDLTSNGRREEYMKGKIFKTKMLKRAFPKPDLGLSQKDKLGSPANNGIHHQSWT